MFARPFAPFRSRPVHKSMVRKTAEAGGIEKLALDTQISIRTLKAEPRLVKPGSQRLRVLKSESGKD